MQRTALRAAADAERWADEDLITMIDEVRRRMEEWWTEVDSDAVSRKDSQSATLELISLYKTFNSAERELVDQVLAGWLVSVEERKRFDALAAIRQFRIRSAVPKLHELESILLGRSDPGAPFELEKVRAVLASLGEIS